MSEEQKNLKDKLIPVLLPILTSTIILLGAAIIYLYSSGYRIDILKREISITGVITVQSDPIATDMFVNGEKVGRTPRSHVLKVGEYDVSLKRESYKEWKKNVKVMEGKSTPIFPYLIFDTTISKEKWKSEGLIDKLWASDTRNGLIFLQKESNTSYSLWEYTINPLLWDFSTNPSKILTLDTNKISISLSPTGQQALLVITDSKSPLYYLLNTQQQNTLQGSNQLPFGNYSKYTVSWSKDGKYILFDSSKDLLSYDLAKQTFTTLLKKDAGTKYVWDTDTGGFFYLITEIQNDELENIYTYSLTQKSLTGNNNKTIIDKIYLQKTDEYIKEYRESINTLQEFSNSPESIQTAGEIKDLDVNVNGKGMYISTSLASYWYFMDTSKFMTISPYPTELISYSPDVYKLEVKDTTGYKIFTFYKEEQDHTVDIGSKALNSINANFFWLSSSSYIYLREDNTIYIADIDGENKYELLESDNVLEYIVNNSREILFTFEKDSAGKLTIVENKFH